jgi:hypothetical protein
MGGTIHSVGTLMMGGVVGSSVVTGGSAGVLAAPATLQPQAGAIELPHDFTVTTTRAAVFGSHHGLPTLQLDPLSGTALVVLAGGVVVWQRVHRSSERASGRASP